MKAARRDESKSISIAELAKIVSTEGREHLHLHERLTEAFRQAILSGVLPKGTWLPAIDTIASQYGMNPLTVGRAFKTLEEQKLIVRKQGAGTYVSRSEFNAAERRAAEKFNKVIAEVHKTEKLDGMQMRTIINELTIPYDRPKKKG